MIERRFYRLFLPLFFVIGLGAFDCSAQTPGPTDPAPIYNDDVSDWLNRKLICFLYWIKGLEAPASYGCNKRTSEVVSNGARRSVEYGTEACSFEALGLADMSAEDAEMNLAYCYMTLE